MSSGVVLDFSKAVPIQQAQPVTLDFSKAQPISQSEDDRNGFQKWADQETKLEPFNARPGVLGHVETALGNIGAGTPWMQLLGVVAHPLQTGKVLANSVQEAIGVPGEPRFFPDTPSMQEGLAQTLKNNPSGLAESAVGGVGGGAAVSEGAGAAMRTPAGIAIRNTVSSLPSQAGALAFPEGPPESIMTRAVRPGKNNTNWGTDVQQAVPLMKSAEQQLGRPIQSIGDAMQATDLAKRNIWQQVQARLGPAAQQSATIDGNQIADAMMNTIDKRTALQNPGLYEQVKAVADTYRHPMSVTDAEDFLQSNNRELIGYYAKNKLSQAAAEADPAVAYKVAEGNALRDALYSKIDDLSGPGIAQLKKAYGSLSNMQKELAGRQMVYARQAPVNLPEQLSYLQAGGKILTGNVLGGVKDIAIQRYLSELNDTNSMVSRAFQKAQPAQPFPAPSFRPPIGTARQLPATSSAPTILPYNPQMTGGENLAAILHYLRNTPAPLALPAEASPIPLPPPR